MYILRTLTLTAALTALLFATPATAALLPASAAMTAPQASGSAPVSVAVRSTADQVVEDQRTADALLETLAAKYQYLDGVTVEMGVTPDNKEAVAYYTEGQIVVSRSHTVTIEKILAHEIWHVIDWRDNGRLDWGEDLPPNNSSDYLKK